MRVIKKTKDEPVPPEIVERVREVINYPRSFRLATELFDAGIKVIKRNGLYLPFFRYSVILEYLDKLEKGFIAYSRAKSLEVYDFMGFTIMLGEECGGFDVDISRARDSEMSLDGRFRSDIKPGLKTVGVQRIDNNFNEREERMEYLLEYRPALKIRL